MHLLCGRRLDGRFLTFAVDFVRSPLMVILNSLFEHYKTLLGLLPPWVLINVHFNEAGQSVEIEVSYPDGHKVHCPECGKECVVHDHRKPRTWRHLDTMQFQTLIHCRVPRSQCFVHGVKTIHVPWAGPRSHFTLLFERRAIEVMLGAKSITDAKKLLKLSWDQVQLIQHKAVERGLKRRQTHEIQNIGIDEKSFGSGQSYITILADHDQRRILDVVQDRTTKATDELIKTLPEEVRKGIKAVTLDMWDPFKNAVRTNCPTADIVHDRFHIEKYLGDAVDKVRRSEHKQLLQDGDETLKGTKYSWLRKPENMDEEELREHRRLKKTSLKSARAWAIRDLFSNFWDYTYQKSAETFFKQWYGWASRSRLEPVMKVAKMIKSHFENILTYLKHRLSNGLVEGFNSKIQSIKANARGFRSFANYRIAILFSCGKLDLIP